MRYEILRAGRFFYRSGPERFVLEKKRAIWMTTSIQTAFGFVVRGEEVWRLRLVRDVPVLTFNGDDGWVELSYFVGVPPDDDDLHEAATAFCLRRPLASSYDEGSPRGWHLPSFYGSRASDTMLCSGSGVEIDRRLTESEVERA